MSIYALLSSPFRFSARSFPDLKARAFFQSSSSTMTEVPTPLSLHRARRRRCAIDLVHDNRGVGRYGVRTDQLLARSTPGIRWQRLDALDEALYNLRKRHVKRDSERVVLARHEVVAFGSDRAARRATEIFGRRAAVTVNAVLRHNSEAPQSDGLWASRRCVRLVCIGVVVSGFTSRATHLRRSSAPRSPHEPTDRFHHCNGPRDRSTPQQSLASAIGGL